MDRFQKHIYNLIYASLVFCLVYMFGLGIGLELNIFLQIILAFIGSLVVKFFLLNPLFLYSLIAMTILGAVLVHRFISPILVTVGERIFFLFDNIIGNIQGKENIAPDNMLIFWGILIIFVSLFTAFIFFKLKNIFLLLPPYVGTFIIYWYNFYDKAYWVLSIFLVIFFFHMGLDKYYKNRAKTKSPANYAAEGSIKLWLKTVSTYSLLIVFIALLLPKSNKNVNWPWLSQTVYNIYPGIENLRSNNSSSRESGKASLFDFSITGFQNNPSKLGGPVSLSDKKIMTVYAEEAVYLRGNVMHTYTGNQWQSILGTLRNHQLGQDFSGLSEYEQKNYYDELYITITNHSFASTTVFSPYMAVEVNSKDDHVVNVSNDNILFFPDGVYDRESYVVKVQKPLPYGLLVSRGLVQNKKNIANLSKYLQVPDNRISMRTKELVREIVKDSKGDFQKAVAIEKYLRNNYNYNLEVNQVPEGKEFIDHFLFDEKEGYCTYFATAMAIMLRLEGIPSRYIEGYLTQETDEPGEYEVRQKNAHAWVEAFIEPVGWMTFEPTPVYPIQPRLENYRPSEVRSEAVLDDQILPDRVPRDSARDIIIDDNFGFENEENGPLFDRSYEDEPIISRRIITDILLILLLLIIPVRFIIGFSKHICQEMRANKLSNNNKIIYLYKQITKLMELLGYPQEYGETHYEYANRIAYKFYIHNVKGIQEITDIFVRSKYSTSPASDEEVLDLKLYRKTLEKRLRSYWNPIIYYYRKYVKKGYRIN
ncbi:transglutaminase domain protein [Proteiniborus sp. DW1]|uniref:transglutaminase domain-containing protein n=1 Tax=Proteiniborus sp. DW1 TaxID=1889883 RepID=UPI00092DF330|nr:transglutaminase domain-containing protein [Proteiniborus sp. DW1]SCG82193.1 transglutaminase domain protein [Proteiniborus sp. DW1]